ncbi:MAG: hypothetical protein K2G63_01285 [Oscillospiraceae bacterium]|nr:hypothetical protein [Oscillospiraceae bacterium]
MNNKHIGNKILSAIVLSAMILATFGGCGDKNSSSDLSSLTQSEIDAVQKPGLKFTYGEPVESQNELDKADPTAPAVTSASENNSNNVVTSVAVVTDASGNAVTEIADVTEAGGAVVTEKVVVTDDAGVAVTEAGGEVVTTVVNVTQVVQKTEVITNIPQSSGGNDTQVTTSGNNNNNYQSNMKSFNAMWLDVSEHQNYTFNDTFIEVKVKINQDIPDGKYPINITWPDFACYDPEMIGKPVKTDHSVNGYIYVNTPAESQDIPSDGFVVYAENVEAKQGEEAVLKFAIKNNPGICAVNFHFEYDENAITIDEAYAVGEFEEISKGHLD